MKKFTLLFLLIILTSTTVTAQIAEVPVVPTKSIGPSVRVKDIASVLEARDNQLFGFGLVVGLRNTGDSRNTAFTKDALKNLLKKMGMPDPGDRFNSRNVASVMVTGTLPPYTKSGQRLDVNVSSLGDASSLSGGTLLLTPLQGPDFKTYAVAQGSVIVGGISGRSAKGSFLKNQTTVGRIPGGAILEVEVPISRTDFKNITLVLKKPNFITASRMAASLVDEGFEGTRAIDASTVKVPLKSVQQSTYVDAIALVEAVKVVPDSSAKVVINARSGTVVIGEKVRLFPVAITHGSVSVQIEGPEAGMSEVAIQVPESDAGIQVQEFSSKIVKLEPLPTLSSLVEALNEIGVSSKDMISILQALKESGALVADIEVI
ncbi:MAG: flagellar basal body P-ring protein FlgI [bacterium]|nr:flagellar basal body P-ring protein FlgI [bacterium]